METGNPVLHMRFCFCFFHERDSQVSTSDALGSIPVEVVMLFLWVVDMSISIELKTGLFCFLY